MTSHTPSSHDRKPSARYPAGLLQFAYNPTMSGSRVSASTEFVNGTARLMVEPDTMDDKDSHVFQRLGLWRVDDDLATAWAENMGSNPTVKAARIVLEGLEANASRKASSALSASVGSSTSDEKKMYKPLDSLFSVIQGFKIPKAVKNARAGDDLTQPPVGRIWHWGAPYVNTELLGKFAYRTQPDMRLVGKDVGLDLSQWYNQDCWGDVKAVKEQGPISRSSGKATLSSVLGAQAIDYARLHLSQRPFLIFSVGLMIFGSSFSLAIVDRDGVIFSPTRDIWENNELLVRCIRSFSRGLSSIQLGMDPTVATLAPGRVFKVGPEASASKDYTYTVPDDYPTFLISPIRSDSDQRFWLTVGKPLWTSPSLTGRGTWVWTVRAVIAPEAIRRAYPTALELAAAIASRKKGMAAIRLTARTYIMKNAWRNSHRKSEASVYAKITENGVIPGLATMACGDDVYEQDDDQPISCSRLRGISVPSHEQKPTHVCHRLVLDDIGRPIWQFQRASELVEAMICVVEAHAALCERGIIHRDISAGNVMLRVDYDESIPEPQRPTRAFLMDVEYAKIMEDDTDLPLKAPKKVPDGPTMTGTMQFQARDVLDGQKKGPNFTILQTGHHDVESFTLVIAYAIFKHLEERFSGARGGRSARDANDGNGESVGEGEKKGKVTKPEVEVEEEEEEEELEEEPEDTVVDNEQLMNLVSNMTLKDDDNETSDQYSDTNTGRVKLATAETWIKARFSESFGGETLDEISEARNRGTAFRWCRTDDGMPAELREYFGTVDGRCLMGLLYDLAEMVTDDDSRRLKESMPVKPRRAKWQKKTAPASAFSSYEEYFSHESLLDTLRNYVGFDGLSDSGSEGVQ